MGMQLGLNGQVRSPLVQPSVLHARGALGLPQLDLRDRLRVVRRRLLPLLLLLLLLLPCATEGGGARRPGPRSARGEPRPLSILQCEGEDGDQVNFNIGM